MFAVIPVTITVIAAMFAIKSGTFPITIGISRIEKGTIMSKSYIPAADSSFNDWAANFMAVLSGKATALNIPAADCTALEALYAAWTTAWQACQSANRGKTDTLNKRQSRKAFESGIRSFVKSWLIYNPLLSDADKDDFGLPIHDTIRTRATPPTTKPVADLVYGQAQLVFHFKDEGAEKRGKPKGVHSLDLRWDFCPDVTSIANVDQLGKSEVSTASPLTLTCNQGERGKQIVFFLRWEGATTLKGPWNGPLTAIFP
jgi:hypothetical protein